MDKNIIIAIDGPSAGGKGTIAKGLARALGFAHLETGLLYRWVGKQWRELGTNDVEAATAIANQLAQNFSLELLNDLLLRSNDAAEAASVTSAHPPVRAALLQLQRDFAANPPGNAKGAILDGRDIGTVVCPNAPIKLYVTASPEARAERRTKELQSYGQDVTYAQVFAEVAARDDRDRTRATAPLQAPAGSIEIDTSNLSAEDAIGIALGIIRRTFPNI